MVVTVKAYNEYQEGLHQKRVNWLSDSFYATLHTGLSFVATNSLWASIAATQISSVTYPAYTAGGVALLSPTLASASNILTVDCDTIKFTSSGAIAASSVVIRNTTYEGDLLCLHIDLGTTVTSGATNNWWYVPDPTNGLYRQGDTV